MSLSFVSIYMLFVVNEKKKNTLTKKKKMIKGEIKEKKIVTGNILKIDYYYFVVIC